MTRFLAFICVCLVAFSCSGKKTKPAEVDYKPYAREFSTGPLVMKVSLDKTRLSLEDSIKMRVEARAPEGYQIQLPELESGVQQFRWELAASSQPRLIGDNQLETSRELLLEPIVILEKMSVKPFTCKFLKDGKSYEVTSQEIAVDVTMPPEEFWSKLDVEHQSAETPLVMPLELRTRWALWAGGIIALLAAGFCLICWLRHRSQALPPPIPADVRALESLRWLVKQNLVEQGRFMEFYNGVQDILRSYIEARFDIRAPELTTQEFMEKIRRNCTPLEAYQKVLEDFFSHCDLVRFATYQPQHQEIQATFDACKNFILESAALQEQPKKEVEL